MQKKQMLSTSLPQHPKSNADPKKVTVATAKGHAVAGQPHIAKHAIGAFGNNKKVY